MKVIDLFSGVGGFSQGFAKAGFEIIVANEIDKDIANSYQQNHPGTIMINDDIENILPKISKLVSEVDVIIGGPPCQGFSMAGARIRNVKSSVLLNDPRNFLFRHYFNIVQYFEPEYFIFENVPGILSMQNGQIIQEIERIFSDKSNFKRGKYYIYKEVMNSFEFGVPQNRNRLIIIGSKKKVDFKSIIKNLRKTMVKNGTLHEKLTIKDAIFDLNWLESGEGELEQKYRFEPSSQYQIERRANSNKLMNHVATAHNSVALNRIMQLKPGDKRLNLKDGDKIKSVHSGAYGRMRWEDVSKTIITRFDTPSSGIYVHPERNRTLTPREAARIQSFDDNFVFHGNKSSIIKQIGNAVPPIFAYFLANVIIEAEVQNEN